MSYNPNLNPLIEIVAVSVTLGIVFAACWLLVLVLPLGSGTFLLVYILILPLYHVNEFYCTYCYQNPKVTKHSFLIYGNKGNKHFWFMQFLCLWEYLFHSSNIFINCRNRFALNPTVSVMLRVAGLSTVIFGLVLRHLAMRTCGMSFDHYIQTRPSDHHVLVVHGVYRWFRHPSYLGFWCFAIGMQLFLHNWLNLVLNTIVLSKFFSVRIQFEEWHLVNKIFGNQYVEYRRKVGLWIPFVRIKDPTR